MSPEELIGRVDALVRQYPIETSDPRDFLEARFDAGLAWVWAAPGEGGLGLDSTLQALVESRLAEKNAPLPFSYNPIGIGMTGPTLLAHGTAQQKSAYLRPLFSGSRSMESAVQ
ncbi:acyl-CoA dehydrogenase family protein [Rhodococcus sp. HM1]|uniref:acyl-CoA dehydrogenase family protein n=1 Tax=Rhodococcus sp. HM1 TaxID=2937759 RepID=UPI00200B9787|nr:acyl-CoA dehydrogenase family protein [Rhodococcus sp. HM1]MCK8672116.1 acyl-CoA dehydrogenase family protein [Rhodococcus sp. HM1]